MRKKSFFVVFLFVVLFVCAIFTVVYVSNHHIKSIQAPNIENLPEILGKKVTIWGIAYPGSRVLIFKNFSFVGETIADNNGNFSQNLILKDEGPVVFRAKSIYKKIESPFGNEVTTIIDLTPPSMDSFHLTSDIPPMLNEGTINLHGFISPDDQLLVNNSHYSAEKDGSFNIQHKLSEGKNILVFRLVDKHGNETGDLVKKEIYVDSTPPEITNSFFMKCNDQSTGTKELVNIRIEEWSGYLEATNSIPIVGCVSGNIKSITVDGKKINWDENKEIYQRVNLYIRGGLNKYKVVAIDKAGNKAIGYVETTATRDDNSINVNLNY